MHYRVQDCKCTVQRGIRDRDSPRVACPCGRDPSPDRDPPVRLRVVLVVWLARAGLLDGLLVTSD